MNVYAVYVNRKGDVVVDGENGRKIYHNIAKELARLLYKSERNSKEIEFYVNLANGIKKDGYRSFLYASDDSAWLYIITPGNSWLYVDVQDFDGLCISYEYIPSENFGSGCRCLDHLKGISVDTLKIAEEYGKNYSYTGWELVPNRYDGGKHRERITRRPRYYKDAYAAMMNSWCADKLIEI